jgi:hypothetical protein
MAAMLKPAGGLFRACTDIVGATIRSAGAYG